MRRIIGIPLQQLHELQRVAPQGPWRHASKVGDTFTLRGVGLVTVVTIDGPTPTACKRVDCSAPPPSLPSSHRLCEGCGVLVWLADAMPAEAVPYCGPCIELVTSRGARS